MPSSGAVSIGSNANCWFLESISDCTSASGAPGLHRDDQFVRLIGGHRVERRQIEQRIGRHRLADLPLGAMADDLQRLLAGDRRAHHLLDILASRTFRVSTT